MPNIGIVDDREAHRTTVAKNVAMYLSEPWGELNVFPFQSMGEYLSWIQEEEIAALIVDERLHEDAKSGQSVDYNGNKLANYLRKNLPDFPIFVVTTHADDQDLQDSKADVDDIINRDKFNEEPETFVRRIVRAGQRFFEQYQSELNQLAQLSEKIAIGQATQADSNQLLALQAKIGISSDPNNNFEKSELISTLSAQLDQFNLIKEKIESLLKDVN